VPNVIVSSIKQAENGDDTIVRCVETSGAATTVQLDLRFVKKQWSGKFSALEIKTLRIKRDGTIKEVNLLEE
jgi:alpha-mannosidase